MQKGRIGKTDTQTDRHTQNPHCACAPRFVKERSNLNTVVCEGSSCRFAPVVTHPKHYGWTGKGGNECWYPCRLSVLKLAKIKGAASNGDNVARRKRWQLWISCDNEGGSSSNKLRTPGLIWSRLEERERLWQQQSCLNAENWYRIKQDFDLGVFTILLCFCRYWQGLLYPYYTLSQCVWTYLLGSWLVEVAVSVLPLHFQQNKRIVTQPRPSFRGIRNF